MNRDEDGTLLAPDGTPFYDHRKGQNSVRFAKHCPWCGGPEHEVAVEYAGTKIKACPAIPDGFFCRDD